MKKSTIAFILLALSLALTVASVLLLPETVTTQLSIGGSAATQMPKLFAIILPFAISAGGSASALMVKSDEQAKRCLIVSAVGILVFVIMLVVNL